MDAFSRIQFQEDTDKIFNGTRDCPTRLLMKGCVRNWLGAPILHNPNVSRVWHTEYNDNTSFLTVQETGTNEFQTLLPVNIRKKGRYPFSPPNGKVVATSITTTGFASQGTEPMMMILESTLLGPAAGTSTTGRKLIAYQMQMPKAGSSKIVELSETLEIVYEGMYELHDLQKAPVPIDITITLTWVINRHNSGVYLRYTNHPYLRITMEFDSKGKLDAINVPESIFWNEAYDTNSYICR